jgi:hypothetical protein
MPQYVATKAENERHYSKFEFVAADDEKALAYLRQCLEAGCIPWEPDTETGDSDALDPVLMLDRCTGRGAQREGVADEIRLPGILYYTDLKRFAEGVAALAKDGAYDGAIDTLDDIIRQACDLLAGEAA